MPGMSQEAYANLMGAGANAARDTQDAKLRALLQGQAAQQQQKLDIDKHAQLQQQEMDAIQKMKDNGLITDGGGAKVGETSVSRGYNPYQLQHMQQGQQSKEMSALGKNAKGMAGPQQDLETADMIHKLAEDPSSIDMGTAQIMKARMAMGGSGGRALGSALRTMGMDDDTLSGDAQKVSNWLTGQAAAKQTPQQINALKEGAFKLSDDAAERFGRAKDAFMQQAPGFAPNMAQSGTLQQMAPSFTAAGDSLVSKNAQRKQQYLQSAQQQQGATRLGQQPQSYKAPQGPLDRLKQLIMGPSSQDNPQQPQAASPMSNPAQDPIAAEMARRGLTK